MSTYKLNLKLKNMDKANYKNELIKRNFFGFLREAEGFSEKSVEAIENAIWLWEGFTKKADFSNFNQKKVIEFKEWLKSKKKQNSQETVSLSYCYDIFRYLRTFFEWLGEQPNYKSKINATYIKFLSLTKNETRIINQSKKIKCPSLEEVKKVIEDIIIKNEIDRRDRALICLIFLTGIRISALMTLPLGSFDKDSLAIDQSYDLGVQTKLSKRITTRIVPFPYKEPLKYFLEWVDYLENVKKFQPQSPIFPATKKENGKGKKLGYYSTGEVESVFWKNSNSIRKIFEKRFKNAGLPYYHPHTFRHLLVKEISKLPLTEEEKKAISQNLGHKDVGTTFGSYGYGAIDEDRQIELIKNIDFGGKDKTAKLQITKDDLREVISDEFKKINR